MQYAGSSICVVQVGIFQSTCQIWRNCISQTIVNMDGKIPVHPRVGIVPVHSSPALLILIQLLVVLGTAIFTFFAHLHGNRASLHQRIAVFIEDGSGSPFARHRLPSGIPVQSCGTLPCSQRLVSLDPVDLALHRSVFPVQSLASPIRMRLVRVL